MRNHSHRRMALVTVGTPTSLASKRSVMRMRALSEASLAGGDYARSTAGPPRMLTAFGTRAGRVMAPDTRNAPAKLNFRRYP